MENKMIVNSMPSPTFNWLGINNAKMSYPNDNKLLISIEHNSDKFIIEKSEEFSIKNIETGMGENFQKEIEKSKNILKIETKENCDNAAIKLSLDITGGGKAGVEIKVNENTKANIFIDIKGKDEDVAAFEIRYILKDNAALNLIEQSDIDEDSAFANDIGGVIGKSASFHLIQLVLGGKENYYGNFASLKGERGNFTYDMAYTTKDHEMLDINSVADYRNKKCNADTTVYGVMRHHSSKAFRGTINFNHGCPGSKGSELEKVILMDKDVHNKTVPVILCDEEDVEGSHGASLGRLDENIMHYMRSRGLPEKMIYEMMSNAMVDEIKAKIPKVEFED